MEIRNSICKTVDGIALLHAILKLIITRGLGLGTVDHLAPEAFRYERLFILILWLPVHHAGFRTRKRLGNGIWGGCN